mgnify:CR=1 FL=1
MKKNGHSRQNGFSMEQKFYVDPNIFQADLEKIAYVDWLFVDHDSRVPNPGDYFVFNIGKESIIVTRGKDSVIRAFFNVCRHRGSHICTESEGNKQVLVCPYHAWSYDLEGNLKSARSMPETFNKKEWSLIKCHVQVYAGMIFINLSKQDPRDFNSFIAPLKPYMDLHGLGDARIAFRKKFLTNANWKLCVENFYECYHCTPSHPEYCKVHDKTFISAHGGGLNTGPDEDIKKYEKTIKEWKNKTENLGYLNDSYTDETGGMRSASRTPLPNGFLSETVNGKMTAPLMGQFKQGQENDYGYTNVSFNAFTSLLMSNDHAVVFNFIPNDTLNTTMELLWLIDKDAKEDVDYKVKDLTWLWDITTVADKKIIENNQKGVLSRAYMPGPYSNQEKGVVQLVDWYLNQIST